ncbi:MAG: hypothetical protein WKG00_16960 [Polyangiaceae bacterium]
MSSLLHLGMAGVLLVGVAGCTDDPTTPGAGPGCNSPGCIGMGQTAGNGSGGSGSGGSSGGVADIQGTVRLMADPAFVVTQSAGWEGTATLVAEPDSGQPIEQTYTGEKAFLLEDVPEGDGWLIVRDEQGGAGVLSTVTALEVPHNDPIVAPIVDLAMLESVADTLVGAPQLEEGSGHMVVFVARDGDALAEVRVDPGSVPGAVVAYDNGDSDAYSTDLDSTGELGKILVLNASAPAGGKLVLDVVDGAGNTYPLDIRVFPNAIAIVGYTLP